MPSYYAQGRGKTPYSIGTTSSPDIGDQGAFNLAQQRQRGIQDKEQAKDQYGYQRGLADQQWGFNQQQMANDAQLKREGYGNQLQMTQMQAEAAKYPHILKQQRWQQLFPFAQGILGQAQGGQYNQYAGGWPVGQQPNISDAPVYNNQQIQEQVNASRAGNDASLASRQRANNQELSGRGFGSRSPLAMMMNQAMFGQNLAANTQAENKLRFDAAGANAGQVLKAQSAREGQYASRQQEDIERNKVRSSLITSLFGSLMGAA
jgi:hypothetical protein